MDIIKHAAFLDTVRDYVSKNPEVAPYVTKFIADGIREALRISNERCGDMEAALFGAIAMKGKDGAKLTLDKLKKWNGNSFMNWKSTIEKLEGKK